MRLSKSNDPVAALVEELERLDRQLTDTLSSQRFSIPVRSTDPPEADPTNIWFFPDGRLRSRHKNSAGTAYVYREWIATAPGSKTSAEPLPTRAAVPMSRQKVWSAAWTASYDGNGQERTGHDSTRLYYGVPDPFTGRNRSLIGFNYADISGHLTGSTINSVFLRFQNLHTVVDTGATVHLGIHNFNTKPATWTGGGIPQSMIVKHKVGDTEDVEIPLPLIFAQLLRSTTGKGIALEAPADSREFAGYAAGVGSGYRVPQLVVNYTK